MTHETNPIPGFCSLSKNWWAFVLRGVLALVISVLAWFMPAEAVLTLTLVFGAFASALPFLYALPQFLESLSCEPRSWSRCQTQS